MSFYRDFPESPKHEDKVCPKCGYKSYTNLFNCYRREHHEDKRPCPLEKV